MTLKPVVLRVQITELPTLVERKSKQTALNNKPEQMSLPINDISQTKMDNIDKRLNKKNKKNYVIFKTAPELAVNKCLNYFALHNKSNTYSNSK